jgi:hypothetical protein
MQIRAWAAAAQAFRAMNTQVRPANKRGARLPAAMNFLELLGEFLGLLRLAAGR